MDEVELLEVNPIYAHICHPDGRESTVSLRHLARQGSSVNINDASNLPQYNGDDDSTNTNTPSIQTYNNDEVDTGRPSLNMNSDMEPAINHETIAKFSLCSKSFGFVIEFVWYWK